MNLENFPGCCGAGVVFALDNEYIRQRPGLISDPVTAPQILQNLKEKIFNAKQNRWGLLTATTNPQQTETEKVLEKLGFKLLHKFKNPIHQLAELRLWGLDLYNCDFNTINAITLEINEPTILEDLEVAGSNVTV